AVVDPLVVVVDGDRELLFRPLLPDDVEVEELFDLFRLRKLTGSVDGARLVLAVFGDDVEADVDALIADVDSGPGDQLLYVALALVAEATTQNVAAVPLLRHVGLDPFLRSINSSTGGWRCQLRHRQTSFRWLQQRCIPR